MAFLPNRVVPLPDSAVEAYETWLSEIDSELSDPECDRYALCRRVLTEIWFPHLVGTDPAELPAGARLALMQMDARNVTREPEYYSDTDPVRYDRVKPLLWMWEMFDRSALGENVHVGVLFRRILARRIFRSCGENFKAFHQVKFSFGYNMDVGDNVVVHREVLLDDRGGIRLGDGVSVSDFVNIYSHSHDVVEGREIDTPETVIGDGVRITYHATIMSGVSVGSNTMIGSYAMATKDMEPNSIYVGIPARKVREKPTRPRPAPTPDPLASES